MRIRIFNAREIRKRLSAIEEISTDTAIFGVAEIWIKYNGDMAKEAMNASAEALLTNSGRTHAESSNLSIRWLGSP